ncbi:hypothetical protein LTSEURB_6137, partial [Salmonella enterica subsp. enterica serovar Urbana str. R8-2977]
MFPHSADFAATGASPGAPFFVISCELLFFCC